MTVQEENEVFQEGTTEDVRLGELGYQQGKEGCIFYKIFWPWLGELKRSFSFIGMIGFSFSIVTSWTALSGVFIVGINAGGPPVMVYGWIAVCLVSLPVAYSMAEMCSMYPVAGGQYSWVAILAPPKFARGLSWISGWFMITGILAMGATNNFVAAHFILGQANLVFPNYTIQRWHSCLVAYAVILFATVVNIWGARLLNRISRAILIWNIASFVVVVVTLLATNDHKQPASFVFQDFQNFTGFGPAMAAILGILQSCFGMCCYDAPAHMTEEMKNASKEAPKAIILSVVIGTITGLVFLITLCFCIGNVEETARSSTGVPVIQIFYDSTGSKLGTCFMASLIAVIALVCANSLLAEGSRAVYAFARDNGLPFSKVFSKVEPKSQIPLNAILLSAGVQIALDAINFGTTTGFNTVVSISTEGFYLSYAMPLLARLLSAFFTNRPVELTGPYALSKPLSLTLNFIGFIFLAFGSITFNFPSVTPVDKESMNYTSAAIGVIGLISLVTWVVMGKDKFTGPGDVKVDLVAEVQASMGEGDGDEVCQGVKGDEKEKKFQTPEVGTSVS
ncbi:hypothetical protein FQN51_004895 [Onygenales sp. PD_10]|nr:hypothetical protein FQN51_004895 [Onygenales sp. PD_10]